MWTIVAEAAKSKRGVAQLAERRAHNPEVAGSSPASATKLSKFERAKARVAALARKAKARG